MEKIKSKLYYWKPSDRMGRFFDSSLQEMYPQIIGDPDGYLIFDIIFESEQQILKNKQWINIETIDLVLSAAGYRKISIEEAQRLSNLL